MNQQPFHISEDGKPRPCRATVEQCRLVHGNTPDEARSNHEKAMGGSGIQQASLTKAGKIAALASALESAPAEIQPGERRALAMKQQAIATMEKAGLTPDDVRHVERAINTAWHLHSGQTRRGQPNAYIEHPLSNLNKIMEYGITDRNVLAAAALHDVVEDCVENYGESGGTPSREALTEHLNARFGKETADIVLAVSNEEADTSGMSREEKNRSYLHHVKEQITESQGAMLVKFSDSLDNAGTLKDAQFSDPKRKMKLAEKYAPLAMAFNEAAQHHQQSGEGYALSPAGHRKFLKATNAINKELQGILRGE